MDYRNLMELKYIELYGLAQCDTNSISVCFNRCKVGEAPENIEVCGGIFKDCYPINIDLDLLILKLDFQSYIAYSITNESFTVCDDYEVFKGNAFRIYEKSRYLDFIKATTFAHEVCGDKYPPLVHYGIACLNHIVDIISTTPPIINEIERH